MPRPKKCRRIFHKPALTGFKPIGIPSFQLEEIILNNDELEAIRLADLLDKKQEEAAEDMQISRQTFGRIIASAHYKIADALINHKFLLINQLNEDNDSQEEYYFSTNYYFKNKCKGGE